MNRLISAISAFFILSSSAAFAKIGPQGFAPFVQGYFVETGTSDGNGIEQALRAGFSQMRSIELNPLSYKTAHNRFKDQQNVQIYFGNSKSDLGKIIEDIQEPITFWLNAHAAFFGMTGEPCPLLEELNQIKNHPIKNHIILIDNMNYCGTKDFDYLRQQTLIAKILEINPNYTIRYVDGGDAGECKDCVMVAIP